jgi:hypothetical protein
VESTAIATAEFLNHVHLHQDGILARESSKNREADNGTVLELQTTIPQRDK